MWITWWFFDVEVDFVVMDNNSVDEEEKEASHREGMEGGDVFGGNFHINLHDDETDIWDSGIDVSCIWMFFFELGESLTESHFGKLMMKERVSWYGRSVNDK